LSLLLELFFLLPFEAFGLSDGFCLFDFMLSLVHEILAHFLLLFDLLLFALQVALFLSLPSISVIAETGSGHGCGNVLDFFDLD
jgi:hypothetical protein